MNSYDYYGNYNKSDDTLYYSFSVVEIHKKQREKEKNRLKIYESISARCFKKVKESSLNEETFCFYKLPEYIPGLPLYNMTECVIFILNILHEKGFNARYCDPFMIFISWTLPKPSLKLITNSSEEMQQKKEPKKNIIDELNLKYKPIEKYNSFSFLPKKKV
jgi:hypothetical protein